MDEKPKKKASKLRKATQIIAVIMIMTSVSFILLYVQGSNVLDCENSILVFIVYQETHGYTDEAMQIYDDWLDKCGYMLKEDEMRIKNLELYNFYDKWKMWNP